MHPVVVHRIGDNPKLWLAIKNAKKWRNYGLLKIKNAEQVESPPLMQKTVPVNIESRPVP